MASLLSGLTSNFRTDFLQALLEEYDSRIPPNYEKGMMQFSSLESFHVFFFLIIFYRISFMFEKRRSYSFFIKVHLHIFGICCMLFSIRNYVEYFKCVTISNRLSTRVKVPSTSSLSVYTKVLAHNLNDIRNWASLIGLLFRICWCLLSIFLIYCSDEWKKLVNLIYCFQVLFRMNFKIMYFLMKILGNTPSADSAASRDPLSSQSAT